MRARVGDLAIVRFDPNNEDKLQGKAYHEKVGIVTGTSHGGFHCRQPSKHPREYDFMYWYNVGGRMKMYNSSLPASRLVRARPKGSTWNGTLLGLAREDVMPVS